MNLFHTFLMICWCLVVMVHCVWADQGEEAVAGILSEISSAYESFPMTKDEQSILKFFATDFTSIQNGESLGLRDIQKYLAVLEEELMASDSITIFSKVTNVISHINGDRSFMTYDYENWLEDGGKVLVEEQGKCTSIFARGMKNWVLEHEHCSTPDRGPERGPER